MIDLPIVLADLEWQIYTEAVNTQFTRDKYPVDTIENNKVHES